LHHGKNQWFRATHTIERSTSHTHVTDSNAQYIFVIQNTIMLLTN
jgi:hypothetical protein